MGVHQCVVIVVSVVAMATGAKNYSKTEENGHFCHFRDTKVRSTPNQHTSWHQYGNQKLSCSFLDQLMPILYD